MFDARTDQTFKEPFKLLNCNIIFHQSNTKHIYAWSTNLIVLVFANCII